MAHGESYPDKGSMLQTIDIIANLDGAEIREVDG